MPGIPGFLVLAWLMAFHGQGEDDFIVLVSVALGAALLALVALAVFLAGRTGVRNLVSFGVVPLALVLLVLTVRTGFRASFENGDVPVEMIVYTQTSPDITQVRDRIQRAGDLEAGDGAAPISIDPTSGFSWPWAWYLRDYTRIAYSSYDGAPLQEAPDASVLMVHANNRPEADTLPEIIQEMLLATSSERQGRVIDHDSAGSMEQKKREGYF